MSEAKGKNVDLTRDKKLDSVLVAKFFTRRSLSIEAVAKTFHPIWRTRGNFEVSDGGNNVLLIAFELEVDAEKVIQGEPWVFDRYLVALERYDGWVLVHNLSFENTAFWV